MEIKHNSSELIASEIVTILKCYDIEVLIERDDSTKIMTTWSNHVTYYYYEEVSSELSFKGAFVIKNATDCWSKLNEVSLSDEEFETLKEYVSFEYGCDSYLDHKRGG